MAARVRKDIRTLTTDELDRLLNAFRGIQDPSTPTDQSYFTIAGYHGEPFRGAGYGNPQWWGGYCNHGNILFPTWHRAYLLKLEKALQCQDPTVTLPFWNQFDGKGIPDIFLRKTYNGKPNPLYSYTFPKTIYDRLQTFPDADYSKPEGKTTCRFPFSGLYGEADSAATDAHNIFMNELDNMDGSQDSNSDTFQPTRTDKLLNENVQKWLYDDHYLTSEGTNMNIHGGAIKKYLDCLCMPYYTIFSNTTSAERWNDDNPNKHSTAVESPHNAIHLAVGGIQIPTQDASYIAGSNGDMGENDTAAFDPIFYFHHAFVDLIFWAWQGLHDQTDALVIEPQFVGYPGTNSVDAQGPTPGVQGGSWLTLDSPLNPFKWSDFPRVPKGKNLDDAVTSQDVANIESLGYTYPSNIIPTSTPGQNPWDSPTAHVSVSGINRVSAKGSFAMSLWAFTSNSTPPELVGTEAVLSRWHVGGCANCQNHLEVRTHFPLDRWTGDLDKTMFQGLVHTRDCPQGSTALGGRVLKLRLHNPLALKPGPWKQDGTHEGERQKRGLLGIRGPQVGSRA